MSTTALFSPSWHRVAQLRPRLRRHARILRQTYTDGTWFLLQDDATGHFHRFTPEAWEVIGRLDGRATVQQVWEAASARLGDAMPTQVQLVALLGQLQQADLVQVDSTADFTRQTDRARRDRARKRRQRMMTPLSIYVPLLDPDRFLARSEWLVRWMFTPVGFLLWIAVIAASAVPLAMHARQMFGSFADQAFALQNLALMALIYPVVKVLHELGHAYCVKRWGGEVHEFGVMLMMLYPVPYLDASAAAGFASRWQRAAVGAAGMMVELLLAAAAVWIWVMAEPGAVRALAANVILLAGLSALIFNGNPLLRLDAYYILSDITRVPNLAQRGNAQIGHLLARLAGAKEMAPPATGPMEGAFLGLYALLSFGYRLLVISVVVALVAREQLLLGAMIGLWAAIAAFMWPAMKTIAKPHTDARLRPVRWRIHAAWMGASALLLASLFLLPAPHATRAQAIVWPPEEAMVRALTPGFIQETAAPPGDTVATGTPLLRLADPEVDQRVVTLEAALLRAEREYQAALADRGQAVALLETLGFIRGQLDRARQAQKELTVVANAAGRFALADPERMQGLWKNRGDLLGHVEDPARFTLLALVREDDIALVRDRLRRIELRFVSPPHEVQLANLLRLVPEASHALPSPVLSLAGGGPFAPDPAARNGMTAFEKLVRLELDVPDLSSRRVEERAHVLFVLEPEPLGQRWWRWLRRAFQRQFGV
jgi:putative peptide zinc metalloprotease protein